VPQTDWLVLWKIYHYPLFFWAYVGTGLPLRMLMALRSGSMSHSSVWLASSTASALFALCTPFAALPAFLVVALAAGTRATYSVAMAVPIALSVGTIAAFVDATLLRVLRRDALNRRRFFMLFGINTLNVSLAMATVFVWRALHPVKMLAGRVAHSTAGFG
jgi:hypothetical protein